MHLNREISQEINSKAFPLPNWIFGMFCKHISWLHEEISDIFLINLSKLLLGYVTIDQHLIIKVHIFSLNILAQGNRGQA